MAFKQGLPICKSAMARERPLSDGLCPAKGDGAQRPLRDRCLKSRAIMLCSLLSRLACRSLFACPKGIGKGAPAKGDAPS